MAWSALFRLVAFAVLVPAVLCPAGTSIGADAPAKWAVEARAVDDRKAVFATVESVDVTLARARIGGTVERLAVDEGSAVTVSERIATVHDPKIAPELAALEAGIAALRSERELARIELERARELRERGTGTQARLDDARTAFNVVESNIAAREAERAVVQRRRDEGAVLSPASGRVLKVHITENSVVLPGDVIATIAAENYILRMHLPERHARFIEEGDTVRVGCPCLTEDERDLGVGRVRQVYPELSRGRVVADVDVAGLGDFFVGERIRVWVGTGTREAIVVPRDFVYRRYGVTYVRLEDAGETVVQPGLALDGEIEILSGLEPGDVLVRP